MTTATHVNTGNHTLYVGRQCAGLPASPWANPFKISQDTPAARRVALSQYRCYLHSSGLMHRLHELKGHVLGCWCDPKPCHAQLLAAYAEAARLQGKACPRCKKPGLKASLMLKNDHDQVAEFWKCGKCGAYGFEDRGAIELPGEKVLAL